MGLFYASDHFDSLLIGSILIQILVIGRFKYKKSICLTSLYLTGRISAPTCRDSSVGRARD
jgi:hypothetical protein